MPDLSLGQVIILVLGFFLIVGGLYGLLPTVMPRRAKPASSSVAIDNDLLKTAVKNAGAKPKTTPKAAKANKTEPAVVKPSVEAVAPLDGFVEELSAQLYGVRTDLGELSLEVQRLRLSLEAKEQAPTRSASRAA